MMDDQNSITVYRDRIDLTTGRCIRYSATVAAEQTVERPTYSLTYEGYLSAWLEVAP